MTCCINTERETNARFSEPSGTAPAHVGIPRLEAGAVLEGMRSAWVLLLSQIFSSTLSGFYTANHFVLDTSRACKAGGALLFVVLFVTRTSAPMCTTYVVGALTTWTH